MRAILTPGLISPTSRPRLNLIGQEQGEKGDISWQHHGKGEPHLKRPLRQSSSPDQPTLPIVYITSLIPNGGPLQSLKGFGEWAILLTCEDQFQAIIATGWPRVGGGRRKGRDVEEGKHDRIANFRRTWPVGVSNLQLVDAVSQLGGRVRIAYSSL